MLLIQMANEKMLRFVSSPNIRQHSKKNTRKPKDDSSQKNKIKNKTTNEKR